MGQIVAESSDGLAAGGTGRAVPLGMRFPAAHQFLRMRLLDEVFPIAPWVACWAQELEPGQWEVRIRWPEIDFEASLRFSAAELRRVYGVWSEWVRGQIFAIAEALPV